MLRPPNLLPRPPNLIAGCFASTANEHPLTFPLYAVGIDHIGPSDFWAVGAELGFITPLYATFWHSTDGGKTWDLANKNISLQYAIDISCDVGVNCWAPLLDVLTQETSIARLNN